MTRLYVGVDLGGTWIKCGIIGGSRVLASRSIRAESDRGIVPALANVRDTITQLIDELNVSLADCRGIGWGLPVLIAHEDFRVRKTYGKYDDALDFDFVGWSGEQLGLPTALENDARLALLGEWQHGAARGSDNCAIVTLGTGIGTAVVFNGRPLRGRTGAAGILGGHLMGICGGLPCACGRHGCYESEAGSKALPEVARRLPGFEESTLAAEPQIDFEAVYRLAAEGDACAVLLRDRNQQLWGELLVDLTQSFDLDRIVIGGGVMRNAEVILPVLQRRVDDAFRGLGEHIEILVANDFEQMALLGVPWLVEERLGEA